MHHTPFFVKVPDPIRHLQDDMSGKVLTKVCQLDDLVEELPALHHCVKAFKSALK